MLNIFRSLRRDSTEPSSDSLTLADLPSGRSAVINEIVESERNMELIMRMGLVPGASVQIINGGDPAIIQMPGTRLAIRRELLKQIVVDAIKEG